MKTTSASSSCPASRSRGRRPTAADLQLRMQGNAFLGAFFRVSPFLQDFGITRGAVPRRRSTSSTRRSSGASATRSSSSNMEVMTQGFARVREISVGELDDAGPLLDAQSAAAGLIGTEHRGRPPAAAPAAARRPRRGQAERTPFRRRSREFDSRVPRRPRLPSAGRRARRRSASWRAGTGAPQSKYVARRETPRLHRRELHAVHGVHHRLPGHRAAQHARRTSTRCCDTAVTNYVTDAAERAEAAAAAAGDRAARPRDDDARSVKAQDQRAVQGHHPRRGHRDVDGFSRRRRSAEFTGIIDKLPLAYQNVPTPSSATLEKQDARAPAACSRSSCPTSARAAASACRRAATTTRCAWRSETEELNAEHDHRAGLLAPAARHAAEIPRPVQRRRRRRTRETADAAQPPDGAAQLRGARLRRRRLRRLRREEHPARGRLGHRGLHAAALPREGRPAARQGRRGWTRKASQKLAALKARNDGGVRAVPPGRSPTSSWAWAARTTRTRQAHRRYEAKHGPITDDADRRRPRRRAAAGRVQPPGPPGHRRPAAPTACRS